MNLLIAIVSILFLGQPKPDSLNLQTCYKLARENYPIYQQLSREKQITSLKKENIKKQYWPQLSLNGKASYQSDVTSVPMSPIHISKDQYQTNLNLNQTIYDGGAVSIQKQLEDVNGSLSRQNVNVSLYQLRNEVNGAYFQVLLLKKKKQSLLLMKKQLEKRMQMVQSQVQNGVLLPGSEDVLKAEMLKTDQSIEGVQADTRAAYRSLGVLIGRDLSTNTQLILPAQLVNTTNENSWKRPEYKLFNLQLDKLNFLKDQTKVQYRPKMSAFAEGLYGRPGLNIFKDEFQFNYMVGVRLQWKLWNWNTGKRDREVLQLQKRNVEENKAAFTRNIKVAVQKDISDIQKYKNMISRDHEIIKLRQKVEQQSASRLHNGVITPTEYVTDLYSVYQARLALDEHQIQWMLAKINYLTKTGSK